MKRSLKKSLAANRALVGDDVGVEHQRDASDSRRPRRRARSTPPMVPMLRTWLSPTSPATSASSGSFSLTTCEFWIVTWRVSAPMCSLPPLCLDVVEPLDAVDVDERRRLREPQAHQRDQAVAAGQHLGVLAVLVQQLRRLLDGGGAWRTRMRLGSLACLLSVAGRTARVVDQLPEPIRAGRHVDVLDAERRTARRRWR